MNTVGLKFGIDGKMPNFCTGRQWLDIRLTYMTLLASLIALQSSKTTHAITGQVRLGNHDKVASSAAAHAVAV
jgi:hypothetical protein